MLPVRPTRSLLLFLRQCRNSLIISKPKTFLLLEIRSVERGICHIAESIMTDSVIFQCACVKLPYFYFRSEIWRSKRSRTSTCVIVPNFVAIGHTIFQDGGRRHLWFLKFRNFKGRSGQDVETASSCQFSWRLVKLLRRYGDFSIFPRWRPSAILDLWCACLEDLQRALVVFITLQNLVGIDTVVLLICKF